MTTNPLTAASQIQHFARTVGDSRAATAMTVLSITLLGAMAIREFRDLFKDLKTDKLDCDESSRHRR